MPEAATRDFEEEEEEEKKKKKKILMPESNTSMIMRSYIDALIARADFATYLDDDVTVEIVETTGPRPASRTGPHHLAAYASVDATVKVKTLIADEGQAALEAEFIGTHTGGFLGMAATGKPVHVPYCVIYDLSGDKITALRIFMPMEMFSRHLGDA